MKSKIILIAWLLGFFLANSFSQKIVWKPITNMPAARRNLSAVSVGDSVYAIAGNGEIKTNYKLDLNSMKWETMAEKPTGCSNFALAEVNGKIYAIGGDPLLDKNEMYDPDLNTWVTKAPMPTKRQHVKCGIVDGKIYVMGGLIKLWSEITNKNEMYDPVTDSWTEKAQLPEYIHGPNQNIVSVDSIIYVISGMTYNGADIWKESKYVQAYNVNSNTWEILSDMPFEYMGAAFVIDKKIYVIGEDGKDKISTKDMDIYKYDPQTDHWELFGFLPIAIKWQAGVTTIGNDSIFICGGNDDNYTAYSNVLMGVVAHSGNFIPEVYYPLKDDSCPVNDNFSYSIPKFTFIDDDTLTYSATLIIGAELPAWLSFNSVTRILSGTPLHTDTLDVVIKVIDNYQASIADTFRITIKSAPSGLKQIKIADFSIFPNPAKNNLNILNPNNACSDYKIFDMKGTLVKTGSIKDTSCTIDISGLSTGEYVIHLISNDHVLNSNKFIKE